MDDNWYLDRGYKKYYDKVERITFWSFPVFTEGKDRYEEVKEND